MRTLFFSLLLFFPLLLRSQSDTLSQRYKDIVVWDFYTRMPSDSSLAQRLTQVTKAILKETPGYEGPVQSSTLDALIKRARIFDVKDVSTDHRDIMIKSLNVNYILYGKVSYESSTKDSFMLELSLQELNNPRSEGIKITRRLKTVEASDDKVKAALKSVVEQLLGLSAPDTLWEEAIRLDTKKGYEGYLKKCLSNMSTCKHLQEARNIIEDETIWEGVPKHSKKLEIKALCVYMDSTHTRHRDSAEIKIKGLLKSQRQWKKREWLIAGVYTGAGVLKMTAGLILESKASTQYQIYKDFPDPGEPIYKERSREETYRQSNRKHNIAQVLTYAGAGSAAIGLYFAAKRVSWSQTLKKADEYAFFQQPTPARWSLALNGNCVSWRLVF